MVMAGNKSDEKTTSLILSPYIELGFEVAYTSTIPYNARYHDLMSGPTSPRSRGVRYMNVPTAFAKDSSAFGVNKWAGRPRNGLRWRYLGRLSSSHLAGGSHRPRLYRQEAVTATCRPSVRSHSSGKFSFGRRRSPDEIYELLIIGSNIP
ncbi:unnamed protein product [Spirodela intermedia]|uniref:Uncharacterized protein n=1 Tax=Spirodela intermedia TaxID=51605 RepID=A0A7I8JM84_SPIIN|nr:unnamed protein product [Spirodela intermedia]CAA6671244.1 unnamed protein product [Spirodela intermedia]